MEADCHHDGFDDQFGDNSDIYSDIISKRIARKGTGQADLAHEGESGGTRKELHNQCLPADSKGPGVLQHFKHHRDG